MIALVIFIVLLVIVIISVIRFKLGYGALGSRYKHLKIKKKKQIVTKKPIVQSDMWTIGTDEKKEQVYLDKVFSHMGVLGTTGSGKTTYLRQMLFEASENNIPFLFVCGKGDKGQFSPYEQLKDNQNIVIIDLLNSKCSAKYNPFGTKNLDMDQKVDFIMGLSEFSEAHYQEKVRAYIIACIKILDEKLSFFDVLYYLGDMEYLKVALKYSPLTKEEKIRINATIKENKPEFFSAYARFKNNTEFSLEDIMKTDEMTKSITQMLKDGMQILVLLDFATKPQVSKALANILIRDVNMSRVLDNTYRLVFFDEFGAYVNSEIIEILARARSSNLFSVISTQTLADISDDYLASLVSNINHWLIFRQNEPEQAEYIAKLIGTELRVATRVSYEGLLDKPKHSKQVVHEFVHHPQLIKTLETREAIYLDKHKDFSKRVKIWIPKN